MRTGKLPHRTLHTFICGGCPTAEHFLTKPMIDNFVFRKEWYDVLKGCSPEVRQEVYEAIMAYAFEDRIVEMSDMSRMAFAFIRPQIDAMRDKYRARCEQNRANASSRNQSPANANDGKQTQPNASDICDSKPYNNNNNNNNNNNIDNNSECDNNAPTHTLTPEEEIFHNFIAWCEKNAPLANRFTEPLDFEQFKWLSLTYGGARCQQCAAELHNKEAYKKNRRAITAWKAFIEKIK